MNNEIENIPLTKRVKGQKIEIKEVEQVKQEVVKETIPEPIQETKKPISDKKREQKLHPNISNNGKNRL